MKTLTLVIIRTAPDCLSYRLVDSLGAIHWSNRVFDCPEGDAGARSRLEAFAARYGWRVVEPRKEVRRKRA